MLVCFIPGFLTIIIQVRTGGDTASLIISMMPFSTDIYSSVRLALTQRKATRFMFMGLPALIYPNNCLCTGQRLRICRSGRAGYGIRTACSHVALCPENHSEKALEQPIPYLLDTEYGYMIVRYWWNLITKTIKLCRSANRTEICS